MKKLIFLFALFFTASAMGAEDKLGLFPFFTMGENIADVWVNPSAQTPAGTHGQVVVDGDRFITQGNGEEIRFWGVNTCFSMNFPEKEDAVRYAKRMASFGINGVRLHHMDNRDIWGKNYPNDIAAIDPDQLDKLDWLIYQFKKNGIYVNINLHVSRRLSNWGEFPHSGMDRHYDKGLDNFEPRMIEYQKKYAKDLLSHVNPYTKMSYLEDPCIAMIEINNENSVVASWFWGHMDTLTPHYADQLQKLWNDWLRKKYGSTEELAKAWKVRLYPMEGEIIPDPSFSDAEGFKKSMWNLENGTAEASLQVQDGVLRLDVKKLGSVSWNPQFYFSGFAVQKGKPYTFKFRVRTLADTPHELGSSCAQHHAEWQNLGFHKRYEVTKEWKEYSFTFTANQDDSNARVSFSGFVPAIYEFDDISVQAGGQVGLTSEEKLEEGTVKCVSNHSSSLQTPEAKADFVNFLIDLETKYWLEMYSYIKHDLGAKAPVSGTQLNYGAHYAQAKLDYCDIHSYWNHPSFPGRPWDGGNWKLGNTSVANALGYKSSTITHLANNRVLGRPYTVSEYNHPYPNLYGAEGFPVLASMAGFQAWNGIFIFSWSHSSGFSEEETPSFFDIKGNSVQLVHMPACRNMFVRGDVKSAKFQKNGQVVYAVTDQEERNLYGKAASGYSRSLAPIGFTPENPMQSYVGVRLTDLKIPHPATDGQAAYVKPEDHQSPNQTVSCTGELLWNGEVENRGFYQVDSPKTKIFTGFIQDRSFTYADGMKIEFGRTILDWATISLTETKKNHWLLAATGLQKNSNCILGLYDPVEVKDTPVEEYPNLINKQITFCKKRGHAPLMCEGIPAKITLPAPKGTTVKYYPLDGNAKRMREVTAKRLDDGHVQIEISREFKTLWYEIVFEKN